MNKDEVKAVLEKQLQLLSEHSKDSANRPGGELGNDTSAIMIIADKLKKKPLSGELSSSDRSSALAVSTELRCGSVWRRSLSA